VKTQKTGRRKNKGMRKKEKMEEADGACLLARFMRVGNWGIK
jgi:hypothetical protein